MQRDLRETAQLLASDKGDYIIDALHRVDDMLYQIEQVVVESTTTTVLVEGWAFIFRHWGESYCGVSAKRADKASKHFAMTDGGWIKLP